MLVSGLRQELTAIVGRAILPAAGFQPAGPAGKRARSLNRLPHTGPAKIVINQNGHHTYRLEKASPPATSIGGGGTRGGFDSSSCARSSSMSSNSSDGATMLEGARNPP